MIPQWRGGMLALNFIHNIRDRGRQAISRDGGIMKLRLWVNDNQKP